MGRFVDFQQPLGIDPGIDLRGRERGMAEQLLDRAQIAPRVSRWVAKECAQRMRRRTSGTPSAPRSRSMVS